MRDYKREHEVERRLKEGRGHGGMKFFIVIFVLIILILIGYY